MLSGVTTSSETLRPAVASASEAGRPQAGSQRPHPLNLERVTESGTPFKVYHYFAGNHNYDS